MKLELKHIAPYLPYGLNGRYTLSEVITLSAGQKDEVRNKILAPDCVPFFLSNCKPILRPMSDLDTDDDAWFHKKTSIEYVIEFNSVLDDLDYSTVQLMIANRYDVFGLIDQGLAIDINTVDI